MPNLEYLTDANEQPKAAIIPIEIWRTIFPQIDLLLDTDTLTDAVEDYCLHQAMQEAAQTPLLDRDTAPGLPGDVARVNVHYRQLFLRDLKKLKKIGIYDRVYELAFVTLPDAANLQDFSTIKAMIGYLDHYRFRLGDYRVGFKSGFYPPE